jgi:hypothetical protein
LFKNGNADEISNYRPICLMQAINKLFEFIINKRLVSITAPLLHAGQAAYLKGKSIIHKI